MSDLVYSLEYEVRTLREENAKLREALSQEREYHRHRSYPDPFKVGAVLGRAGGLRYPLQILHVWNSWPTVDIEVALPPSNLLGNPMRDEQSNQKPLTAEQRAVVKQYLADVMCSECHCPKHIHRPGCSQS